MQIHQGGRLIARTILILGLTALGACEKHAPTEAASKKMEPVQKIDACSLLTKEEIQAVQNSPIKDTTSSEHSEAGLRVSQCFYSAAESNRSVSLQLTQADPDSPERKSGAIFWEQTFGRHEKDKEKAGEKEKEEAGPEKPRGEEEGGAPPRKIEGIGNEAFWSGNRVGGALYVLKNDTFIRISLGGPDPEETRIEKSKALAQKALNRL